MSKPFQLAVAATFVLLANCRSNNGDATGGAGGQVSETTTSTMSGTMTTTTGTTNPSSSGGAGGQVGCTGDEHGIDEISKGTVGPGTRVSLTGVVAMSQKFLVSGSKSCLWGVYVSSPGLTETKENTGALALSYGTPPSIPASGGTKAYCPELGVDPTGDKIPDDTAPGDVLNLIGVTAYFPSKPNCVAPNPANTVPMRQIGQICSATKTGTAPVPAAHVLTSAELTSITSLTDSSFHDAWGGVKVRISNSAIQPVGGANVDMYGQVIMTPSIPVGDKLYYQGYNKSQICHSSPIFATAGQTETFVDGFHYLDFCAWGLQVNDKCADMSPASDDCVAAKLSSCQGE